MRLFLNTLFKDKLRFYQILSLLLAIISIIAIGSVLFLSIQSQKQQESSDLENTSPSSKNIPMYDQITSIVAPLKYSGLQALLRDDVSLQIDFDEPAWHLKNIHRFDENGDLLLDENIYGLCGELAAFVYPKVKPILGPLYDIKFVQVAESGFFLRPQSSHIALQIINTKTSEAFLLDPSFHRYIPIADSTNYLFYDYLDSLDFIVDKIKDVKFSIGIGIPISIHKDIIIFLTVEGSEGRLDKENFSISVAATRRYQYAGRYVFSITRKEGNINTFENPLLIKQLLKEKTYKALYKKIFSWVSSQS